MEEARRILHQRWLVNRGYIQRPNGRDTVEDVNVGEQPIPRTYQVGTPSTPLTTQESAVILNLHDSLQTTTQTDTDSIPTLEVQREHEGPTLGRDGLNPNAQPFEFGGPFEPQTNPRSHSGPSADEDML